MTRNSKKKTAKSPNKRQASVENKSPSDIELVIEPISTSEILVEPEPIESPIESAQIEIEPVAESQSALVADQITTISEEEQLEESIIMEEENDYIKVVAEEGSEDFMEFPKEEDDTLLLSTLKAQFPHAIGLKYRGPSGAWRALSANENVFSPPKGGWVDIVYCVTVSDDKKRKAVNDSGSPGIKKTKGINTLLQDIAVLNLPFSTTEEELKEYFEKNYGDLDFCEIKTFRENGKSKGFGFIRFKDADAAKQAVSDQHYLMGRRVDVKQKQDKAKKLFIGRLKDGTTTEDLREYFSQFGELTDVYIPTPFRNFGFITFGSTEVAKAVMQETHYLNGSRLNIVERSPDPRTPDQIKSGVKTQGGGVKNQGGYSTLSYDNSGGGGGGGGVRPGNEWLFSTDSMSSSTNYTYTPKPKQPEPPTQSGAGGLQPDLKNLLIQLIQNS